MAIADGHGLPLAVRIESASPHEVTLVESTIRSRFTRKKPKRLIGDLAYDSDPLDEKLREYENIDLIAPHKENRVKPKTQDGRGLRRYRRRWQMERLFAWLHNFRRIVTRWEYYATNFLGMVRLGCLLILFRRF
jgi:transposase